jgi:dienelactone hydrolase
MTPSTKSFASSLLGLLAAVLSWSGSNVKAAGPRALPEGRLPNDVRLEPPKDLDGYFPFTPAKSSGDWAKRAERVRRQILVSQGLWPMPTKTPLNPVVHGKIERDNYTVEKVYFESIPGFYVTGNLYRPRNRSGRMPGVLCPHGHWDQGRFMDQGVDGVRKEIAQGAERFEEGGRSVLQARCVQLARMGCVVFHYDMIGYADSLQIPGEIAHRFAKQRPEMNTVENWGLFSPQAEAHFQSVMGLQTWNSIRSIDFLLGLSDVDPERIACTGESGGGTQTFMLGAIDDRVKVAFPAVMVSTAMQGGCTCENASGLRVGAGNVEFAALFAPRPLGLTSADDWTKEMATKGFPELKQHYTMLGAPDNIMLNRGERFGHNYNYVSRAAMYSWFNRHLKLGLKEPIAEEDYKRLTHEEMSVWDDQHPKPEGGPEFERKLMRWLTDDANRQLRELAKAPAKHRELVAGAIDVIIGRSLDEVGEVEWDLKNKQDRGGYLEMAGLLRNQTQGEELPVVFLNPKQWNRRTVIWVAESGKAGLFAEGSPENPKAEVQKLLDAGVTVVGADLLFQGEFLADGKPVTQTRSVKNPREAGAYTFGYNHTLFAQRVHDVLTVVKFVRDHEHKSESIDIIGLGAAGSWVAAALPQTKGSINRAAVEPDDFRFGKIMDLHDPSFLPGGAKYGDLPGMITLSAPTKVLNVGKDGVTATAAVDSLTSQ